MNRSSCINELSLADEKDAVVNRKYAFVNDVTKNVKNKKVEDHGTQFSQQLSKRSKGTAWQ